MSERNEIRLSDMIEIRAEQQPDRDVLTFEHYSLDDGASADEPSCATTATASPPIWWPGA